MERIGQFDVGTHRFWRHQLQRLLDAVSQIERRLLEFEPPGLNLRKVEDLINDREQMLAAQLDGFGHLTLWGSSRLLVRRSDIPMIAFIGVRIS